MLLLLLLIIHCLLEKNTTTTTRPPLSLGMGRLRETERRDQCSSLRLGQKGKKAKTQMSQPVVPGRQAWCRHRFSFLPITTTRWCWQVQPPEGRFQPPPGICIVIVRGKGGHGKGDAVVEGRRGSRKRLILPKMCACAHKIRV